jgi:hypothetical protein
VTTAVAGLALLFLTGNAVARLLRVRLSRDPIVSSAFDLALGLSFWPILLLWTSTAGLRLGPGSVRVTLLLLSAVIGLDEFWKTRRPAPTVQLRYRLRGTWPFFAIAAAAVWTRVLHIRNLVVPMWVDSLHHMMIVRLILDHGRVPSDYRPYIPASDFYYHWGYHAIQSSVAWLTGRTDPLEVARAMLHFGQLLNVLTILPMYAAGRILFRSRRAGLWAAALAAVVSFFPAYYVSWGRYTHLCGTLILPLVPLAASRMRTREPGTILATAIVSAGLALVHIRLALFAATAVAVLAGYQLVRRAMAPRLTAWIATALLAVVLTLPWLVKLTRSPYVHRILSPPVAASADWDTPTGVQSDLAWAPRNRELLIFGTGGIAGLALWNRLDPFWRGVSIGLWLAAMALTELANRRKRSLRTLWRGVGALAIWCAVTALVLNLQIFGLPRLRVASNTSAVITLFIPLCLSLAGFISSMSSAVVVRPRRIERLTNLAIVIVAAVGALTLQNVVNPNTILARQADIEAMAWIKSHTSPESIVMVRSRRWLGRSRRGIDGGAWIQVLTDRRSILPPGLYPWVAADDVVAKTESLLSSFENAGSMDDRALQDLLIAAGVTHVYFGDSDEGLSPAVLADRTFARLLYRQGRVHIFAIEPFARAGAVARSVDDGAKRR